MAEDRSVIKISGAIYGTENSCTRRAYILVHEPGCVPEKKVPRQTHEGVTEFLLALQMCRPKGTHYTVVQVVWDGDIWVDSGSMWLDIEKGMAPRKFAKLKRKVADEQKRLKAPICKIETV
jgi:hypothetical protein